ncbi:MAG: Holliday junction resolvase RuvX [Alphaproteobacteria bacterium]|nr:Holliday junction resolvase RuvX [Alphaproteobacteria bacterium]
MILPNFKVFKPNGRLLGLDWGARRTGVAVSDASGDFVFARPPIVTDINDTNALVNSIVEIITNEDISGIVIGLPLRTDGTESETTACVRRFANALAAKIEIPIVFLDETLSSMSAQEEMGRVRRSDIKEKLDSNSARVILENAIAMIKRG